MENLVDRGLVKSIGVSNFSPEKIQDILSNARIPPAVNQVSRKNEQCDVHHWSCSFAYSV